MRMTQLRSRKPHFVKPTHGQIIHLVETSRLPIPFLYGIQRTLSRQIEHKQDCHSIITHQRQHVHEFSLATQVPYRERDGGPADGDRFFHEVDACRESGSTKMTLVDSKTRTQRLDI